MSNYVSFLSEHSVEYCLVYQITRHLERNWSVTPLFFWRSREGNPTALRSTSNEQIRVLAVYARRPKIHISDGVSIFMKLNEHILRRAYNLTSYGIPVLCAVPRSATLLDFKTTTKCNWFHILKEEKFNELIIRINLYTGDVTENAANDKIVSIRLTDITTIIEQNAKKMDYRQIIEALKFSEYFSFARQHSFPWFGSNYKPIILLLRKKHR